MTADAAIERQYETDLAAASTPSASTTAPAAAAAQSPLPKNPWLAGLLSLFPGLGHVYDGLYLRGLTCFLIVAGLIRLSETSDGLFGFAVAFFWAFNVLDAYRQATLINLGYASDLGISDAPRRPGAGQGAIAAGIILFTIGLLAALDRFLRIDLEWIAELWPFGFMVLGAWLVGKAVLRRRDDGSGRGAES